MLANEDLVDRICSAVVIIALFALSYILYPDFRVESIFLDFLCASIVIKKLLDSRAARRAREVNEKVSEALRGLKDKKPGKNVAEISAQEVAEAIADTRISDEQLTRLVEQRKQELLIDDEYFQEELHSLIVDYLQPLPRNAKRLLNRFRVSLLIAHSRGLLTSEPKVTAQQIGKWLVLMERWPQLGRSLCAVPEKMANLEEGSKNSPSTHSLNSEPDPFMESVKILAAPYCGDEDLRKFIRSSPALANIAPRLVHYGAVAPSNPGGASTVLS